MLCIIAIKNPKTIALITVVRTIAIIAVCVTATSPTVFSSCI